MEMYVLPKCYRSRLLILLGVYWFYAIFLFATAAVVFLGLEETGFPRRTHQENNDEQTEHQPKTYLQKLNLITSLPTSVPFYRIATTPLLLLADPIVWWCAIMYGFGVAWLTIMATESSTIFTLYGFSPSTLGLTNIAPLIGSCLVVWLGGSGTDQFMV